MTTSGGRFDARGYTLALLMPRAYGVMDWNMTGGPSWVRTDRFDVNTVAEACGRNLTAAFDGSGIFGRP